jgi:hypothetical protein
MVRSSLIPPTQLGDCSDTAYQERRPSPISFSLARAPRGARGARERKHRDRLGRRYRRPSMKGSTNCVGGIPVNTGVF